MLEEACVAVEVVEARDRQDRQEKYARRNKMRYIDHLLNELEMLNLADKTRVPGGLATAISRLIDDSEVVASAGHERAATIVQAMDALYEIQDSLMYTQLDDE